jgi:ubiquinone/menaquinone biosynthesis C-methylase UbiE
MLKVGDIISDVNDKLAQSLSAESAELIPMIPYLLQDLWELGSTPSDIVYVIKKHIKKPDQLKVLDLGCGKGAVSVHLAKTLGCYVLGIDLVSEFIEYAEKKAVEFAVDHKCTFLVGDINETVLIERDYDLVILGSVGGVLGDPTETIEKLKQTIKPHSYMVIDDAYSRPGAETQSPSFDEWQKLFEPVGVRLLEAKLVDDDEKFMAMMTIQQDSIRKRAEELKRKHPDKAFILDGYVAAQQAECKELTEEIIGVTWLLQRI